jgi:serine/threonine protein phosphatase 1
MTIRLYASSFNHLKALEARVRKEVMEGKSELKPITYVVGDVNGMGTLLSSLLRAISKDAERQAGTPRIVFVGNLSDMGPETKLVIEEVTRTLDAFPGSTLLTSRRDRTLLDLLDGEFTQHRFNFWMYIGGDQTLASFGLSRSDNFDKLRREILRQSPQVVNLLRNSKDLVIEGDYCFVHGGINPTKPLAEQAADDVHGSRIDFLRSRKPFEKIVVHGYLPTDDFMPVVRSNRISINTAAHKSGRLTALVIEDGKACRFWFATQVGEVGVMSTMYSVDKFETGRRDESTFFQKA